MTDNKQTFVDSEFVESKVFDMFYFEFHNNTQLRHL